MRPATAYAALAAALLVVPGAATAGQVNGKHTTSEAARPPCAGQDPTLLSPRGRRAELALLRARLALIREEELARLRSRLEARLRARERELDAGESDRALNLP
ncbi:MAG TPA: hypothetical protein VNJ51_13515 [Candidatus Dormibacteraeota bacterium]|nr:hypothetical protein [Candidatus Dormibacteraeota bacterium]